MPNHQTHDLVCICSAPVISAASLTYLQPREALLLGAGIILTNLYLSPDLDTNSRLNKRWSVLNVLWIPYRRMFHHRSFWTHSGPISATVRILYLLLILSPVLFVVSYHDLMYVAQQYRVEFLLFYVAACLSDTLHTGLDFIDYVRKIPFGFWKNSHRIN